jgi:gluconolactonase
MTLIREKALPNPLKGWQLDPATIRSVGHDLSRPECILAERNGALWAADARGGIMHILPDGRQNLITPVSGHSKPGGAPNLFEGALPNGLAFARNGDLLIANFGVDRFETMTRDGRSRTLYDSIDGVPLGKVNFVLRDSRDRIWITISTRISPWSEAINNRLADGYIVLIDDRGPRIVADGFAFTNEIRFDAKEEWLYVAETCARRVTRLRVAADGSLRDREVYGPSPLGSGLIDGIAFDAHGNLWATMIFADRLVAITPDGELLTLFADGDTDAAARLDAEFDSGRVVSVETMSATGGTIAPWLTSLTFGGGDLRTVYLGSLKGPGFHALSARLPACPWSTGMTDDRGKGAHDENLSSRSYRGGCGRLTVPMSPTAASTSVTVATPAVRVIVLGGSACAAPLAKRAAIAEVAPSTARVNFFTQRVLLNALSTRLTLTASN